MDESEVVGDVRLSGSVGERGKGRLLHTSGLSTLCIPHLLSSLPVVALSSSLVSWMFRERGMRRNEEDLMWGKQEMNG